MKLKNKLIVLPILLYVANVFTADISLGSNNKPSANSKSDKAFYITFDDAPVWYALGAPIGFLELARRIIIPNGRELTTIRMCKEQKVPIERCGELNYFYTSARPKSQKYECLHDTPGQPYKILSADIDSVAVLPVQSCPFLWQDYCAKAELYLGYNSKKFFWFKERPNFYARILKIVPTYSCISPDKRPMKYGPEIQIPLRNNEISELSNVDIVRELIKLDQISLPDDLHPDDLCYEEAQNILERTRDEWGALVFHKKMVALLGKRARNFNIKNGAFYSWRVLFAAQSDEQEDVNINV